MPNSWAVTEEYLFRKGWTKNKPMRNARNRKLKEQSRVNTLDRPNFLKINSKTTFKKNR